MVLGSCAIQATRLRWGSPSSRLSSGEPRCRTSVRSSGRRCVVDTGFGRRPQRCGSGHGNRDAHPIGTDSPRASTPWCLNRGRGLRPLHATMSLHWAIRQPPRGRKRAASGSSGSRTARCGRVDCGSSRAEHSTESWAEGARELTRLGYVHVLGVSRHICFPSLGSPLISGLKPPRPGCPSLPLRLSRVSKIIGQGWDDRYGGVPRPQRPRSRSPASPPPASSRGNRCRCRWFRPPS